MNYEYFLAKRLIKRKGKNLSRPIIIIATLSITLGVAVMILSISILQGFKSEIKEKIVGFASHVQVLPYNLKQSESLDGISLSQKEKGELLSINNVKSISPFATKGGVIKTKTDFQGVMLKGVDKDYDTTFFHHYLKKGRFLNIKTNGGSEALVSKVVAEKLNLSIGDKLRVFFYIDNNYRARAFSIVGIYETGLSDYDERFVICDIAQVQGLNSWGKDTVEGYEILLKDFSLLDQTSEKIYYSLGENMTIQTIEEIEPNLFSWLDLLDSNVVLILIIMMLVSIVTITSTLLIIIFEQTTTIGVLKSMGSTSKSIIKIFLYNATYIILRGLLFGNALALGIAFIQDKFNIFKLPQESYFLTSVPIEISAIQIIMVNLVTIIICVAALLIPARSISKIDPIKSIRFD
ncbi:MAG TPA: ABC transporter permease [Bacteroidales bacterium]|nr:ABC transporter permease [Bacteroidales bacterium]